MNKSVLVIDDEKDFCEVISRALKKEGFDVDCAFNLAEAGPKLAVRPDIVILDNNLPDGQGLTLIKYIKANLSSTAVILITAMGNSKEKAIENGADVFLEKPLTYSSIFNAINSAIHKQVNL